MNAFSRMATHLMTTTSAGRRAFPAETLTAIEHAIAAGETRHRAEVRLIVEPALPIHATWDGVTSRDRANDLFAHYRIWDTEENCGVLIYINLADRKVEIVADRTVGRLIDAEQWQAICRTMTQGFARGAFHDSTLAGITQLNALLETRLPADGSRPNQLSNEPILI